MCKLLLSAAGVLLFISAVQCQARYTVPEATIEFLSPKGLKFSIPADDEEASLVAFHVNINQEFDGLEHGQFAKDILKVRDGRWTYTIPNVKVKKGDVIYYWVYVIVDGLGYQGLDRSYTVTQPNPHGTTAGPATPTDVSSCKKSATVLPGAQTVCQGQVILDKRFDTLEGFVHQVQIGGSQQDDEFTVFTKDTDVSLIENNNLVIKPKLLEEKYDADFVRGGNLTLEGCTASVAEQCSKQAISYLILPPVVSARLSTRGSFSFQYGTVEMRARLPRGDWIVPELWLEPLHSAYQARSGRVVLGLSPGNVGPTSADGKWPLDAGVTIETKDHFGRQSRDSHWAGEYHNFKLSWTPDKMVFYVDDKEITRLPTGSGPLEPAMGGGKLTPFDKEFFITVGVHVAGGRDFPDGMPDKPWKNSNPKRFVTFWENKAKWHPSWSQDSALRVEYIKVTAL